jgi:hypothetical protein
MIEAIAAVAEKTGEVVAEAAEKTGEVVVETAEKTGEVVATETAQASEVIANEGVKKIDSGALDEYKPDIDKIKTRSLESIKIENQQSCLERQNNAANSIEENLEANEKVGLTDEEKALIKEETGWSDEIIDHIENMDQYEIYKNANLHEAEIDGRKCLIKDIDMDYVDPKTGKTNRELMIEGRSPIDPETGDKIELHHMGQEYDSPFAELCEDTEHGDGKYSVLHTKMEGSWRKDPKLLNQYNNVDRPNHWKARAKEN